MLKYELIEDNSKYTAYKYYPENKDKSGILVVNKADKEIVRMELAPNDEFRWYALKLYKRIKEWLDEEDLPQTGKIAWY